MNQKQPKWAACSHRIFIAISASALIGCLALANLPHLRSFISTTPVTRATHTGVPKAIAIHSGQGSFPQRLQVTSQAQLEEHETQQHGESDPVSLEASTSAILGWTRTLLFPFALVAAFLVGRRTAPSVTMLASTGQQDLTESIYYELDDMDEEDMGPGEDLDDGPSSRVVSSEVYPTHYKGVTITWDSRLKYGYFFCSKLENPKVYGSRRGFLELPTVLPPGSLVDFMLLKEEMKDGSTRLSATNISVLTTLTNDADFQDCIQMMVDTVADGLSHLASDQSRPKVLFVVLARNTLQSIISRWVAEKIPPKPAADTNGRATGKGKGKGRGRGKGSGGKGKGKGW